VNKTKLYQVGSSNIEFEGNTLDGVSVLPETMNVMNVKSVASGIIKFLKFDGIKPPTTCALNKLDFGTSVAPSLSWQLRLLGGLIIHASIKIML